ncbi:MAG: alpha-ketoglutarate-dependent dioxygenase AlkB [Proteobacteria bacterium]|nr:alpha-ketoglutarate-dependent dioxygenase AlkB [Pseudomonadota bacterium]
MQTDLFSSDGAMPSILGLRYEPEFLTRDEECSLLAVIRSLPLQAAKYKEYLARRRVASFGGSYDFDSNVLRSGEPLDERLVPLRNRVADWLGIEHEKLVHALVAEYASGTPLGWHRDVPDFEVIAGVSLGSDALLRFRPFPPDIVAKRHAVELAVAARSAYRMEGEARWDWQHCVPPVRAARWSITFRTARSAMVSRRRSGGFVMA